MLPTVDGRVSEVEHPISPGMKYKHYAPEAPMTIFEGDATAVKAAMQAAKADAESQGKKVALIEYGEYAFEEAAHTLFSRLRQCDEAGVDLILITAVKNEGQGFAVMNRMRKAAGYNVIKV